VRKQLERLGALDLVDRDFKGRYRKHRERQNRRLKPCASKLFPKCRGTDKERKTLSRGGLKRRGWPLILIDKIFPYEGADYRVREVDLPAQIGRSVKVRFYRVSRIKAVESQPWFEIERANILRQYRSPSSNHA
jgi:hypothetical protein